MGVNKNTMDEIFDERAQFLLDVDEVMLERFEDQVPVRRMDIPPESLYIKEVCSLQSDLKINVVGSLYTQEECKVFIQGHEKITNRKFEPLCLRKIRYGELEDRGL